MRYAVVIEKAQGNFSAYVPDLPGCVATGATIAEIEVQIREAIDDPLCLGKAINQKRTHVLNKGGRAVLRPLDQPDARECRKLIAFPLINRPNCHLDHAESQSIAHGQAFSRSFAARAH